MFFNVPLQFGFAFLSLRLLYFCSIFVFVWVVLRLVRFSGRLHIWLFFYSFSMSHVVFDGIAVRGSSHVHGFGK